MATEGDFRNFEAVFRIRGLLPHSAELALAPATGPAAEQGKASSPRAWRDQVHGQGSTFLEVMLARVVAKGTRLFTNETLSIGSGAKQHTLLGGTWVDARSCQLEHGMSFEGAAMKHSVFVVSVLGGLRPGNPGARSQPVCREGKAVSMAMGRKQRPSLPPNGALTSPDQKLRRLRGQSWEDLLGSF